MKVTYRVSKQYIAWFQALGNERKTVRRHWCGVVGWGKTGRDNTGKYFVGSTKLEEKRKYTFIWKVCVFFMY